MDDKVQETIALIHYASALTGPFMNSASRFTSGSVRKAITTGRMLLEGSINGIFAVLIKYDQLQDITILHNSFKNSYYQLLSLIGLLEITWPQEFSRAMDLELEGSILRQLFQNRKFSRKDFEELISGFESRDLRKYKFFERILTVGRLIERAALNFNIQLSKANVWQIRRSIKFPPELKQAGIGILSYFNEILNKKYPDIDVGITIEQMDEKVTLIIDTPEGEKERIERELSDYGLVVTGGIQPEKYLNEPYGIMMLKHKLELAALEVRQTKELLHSERNQYDARIGQLEQETQLLRKMLDKDMYYTSEMIVTLKGLSEHATKNSEKSLQLIVDILERGISENDEDEVVSQLQNIQKEDKSLYGKIEELIIKGAIQGAAGNYLYSVLQALSRCM